jgi:PAS domain S-box-containing protein
MLTRVHICGNPTLCQKLLETSAHPAYDGEPQEVRIRRMTCMRCGWAAQADANAPWWEQSFCRFCLESVLQNWILNGAPEPRGMCQHGSWYWDLKNNVCWDLKTRELFGRTLESAINKAVFDEAVHPDDREHIEHARRYAIEHQAIYTVQYRIWTPAGDLRVIRNTARGYYDASGKPIYMMGICSEVTR